MSAAQDVWVVDSDGSTHVFKRQDNAERWLVQEAYRHVTHLTITQAAAPADLDGEALLEWCIGNVPPITCESQ